LARCINWEKKTPEFPYGKDPVFGLILKGFWVQKTNEKVSPNRRGNGSRTAKSPWLAALTDPVQQMFPDPNEHGFDLKPDHN